MPQNLIDRQIHQVPIICPFRILQVERHYLVALLNGLPVVLQPFRGQPLELIDKNQKAAEPHLMPARHQQFRHFIQRETSIYMLNYLANLWRLDAQELVALTIVARPGLEEPQHSLSLPLVVQRLHVFYDLLCLSHII